MHGWCYKPLVQSTVATILLHDYARQAYRVYKVDMILTCTHVCFFFMPVCILYYSREVWISDDHFQISAFRFIRFHLPDHFISPKLPEACQSRSFENGWSLLRSNSTSLSSAMPGYRRNWPLAVKCIFLCQPYHSLLGARRTHPASHLNDKWSIILSKTEG